MQPNAQVYAATQLRDIEEMYAAEDAARDAQLAAACLPKSQYLSARTFIKVGRDLRRRQ